MEEPILQPMFHKALIFKFMRSIYPLKVMDWLVESCGEIGHCNIMANMLRDAAVMGSDCVGANLYAFVIQ
jgi:hypothetical protein